MMHQRQPFVGPLLESTRVIPLTQGQFALVDEDEYASLIVGPPWHARFNPYTKSFYAQRNVLGEGRKRSQELMHQTITDYRWQQVDHINHDTLDNRRVNLRDGKFNTRNRRVGTGSSSKYHGVYRRNSRDKFYWRAGIRVDGVTISLGTFPYTAEGEEAAARAYDAASIKYHGEYGTRNF